jgi:hypothetical protein
MPIVRRRLSAAERTVNPGGCLLREEELAMIVIPASRLDGRLAGGIHEVAVASMSIDAQAHPSNTKRLLTKASRLENQNVSRTTSWGDPNRRQRAPACGFARIGKCIEPALLLG